MSAKKKSVKAKSAKSAKSKTQKLSKVGKAKMSKESNSDQKNDNPTSAKSGSVKPQKSEGVIHFSDYPSFKPNLTPKQILHMGSFGGTYFRPIYSSINKHNYKNQHRQFPSDWFAGLNIEKQVTSEKCTPEINKYKVKAGSSLTDWETSGWIKSQDPYGWFQWYCRFYQGRRTADDKRQVGRWDNYAGEIRGRWRRNLIKKCITSNKSHDDATVSPVIRQGLQHWGYMLTKKDYEQFKKKM